MIPDEWDDGRLKKEILQHIKNETFVITRHAATEQKNDAIDVQDILHVLKTGKHERKYTEFDNKYQRWKYRITGETEEFKTVSVVISFLEKMVIVTVFKISKYK